MINTREIASEILQRIYKKQHLDKICDNEPNFKKLDQRDKNFVRLKEKTLPFKDKEFDFIIASHVLEHVEDVDFFLKICL